MHRTHGADPAYNSPILHRKNGAECSSTYRFNDTFPAPIIKPNP